MSIEIIIAVYPTYMYIGAQGAYWLICPMGGGGGGKNMSN